MSTETRIKRITLEITPEANQFQESIAVSCLRLSAMFIEKYYNCSVNYIGQLIHLLYQFIVVYSRLIKSLAVITLDRNLDNTKSSSTSGAS